MQGKEIFYISYFTSAGLNSPELSNTINSRMLMEQDTLHLPKINNIILTGECIEAGIKESLSQKLPKSVNIEYFELHRLRIDGIDPKFSRYAVPCGAALRILEKQEKSLYDVDLTPPEIKAAQKFQLGIAGWIMIFLVPLFAFYTTVKYGQQIREVLQLETQIQSVALQADQYQQLELQMTVHKRNLAQLNQVESMLDSLAGSSATWNQFLARLATASKRVGSIWFTGFSKGSQGKILLQGYATQRSRVLKFSETMGNAEIIRVNGEEIRERKIFIFTVEVDFEEEKVEGEKN